MDFFPGLIVVLVMELLWLVTVFCFEDMPKMSDAQMLLGTLSIAFIITITAVVCTVFTCWAIFWALLTFMLAKAIHANHMGTRPISDKED